MLRRVGLGVVDQGLLSLTSFVVSVFAARALSANGFGAFALAFAGYWVVLGVSRGLHSETLLVRFGGCDAATIASKARAAQASVLLLAVITAAVALAASLLVRSSELRWTLVVLACCVPGLLAQDFLRFTLFASRRGIIALGTDVGWAVAACAGTGILAAEHWRSAWAYAAAWGVPAYLAALAGAHVARIWPSVSHPFAWLHAQRHFAGRYAGESLIVNGTSQIALWLIATMAGLTAVAGIRGAIVLLGPVTVIYLSVNLVAIPEAVRVFERGASELGRFVRRLGIALTVVCALWGGLVALLVPSSIGEKLLGASWASTSGVILPMTIAVASSGTAMAAVVGLRALAAATTSFSTRLAIAPVTLVVAIVGAALYGAKGGAIGLAIANAIGALAWWVRFRSKLALISGGDAARPAGGQRITPTPETLVLGSD